MLLIGFAGIWFAGWRRAGEIFAGSTMFLDQSFRFGRSDRQGALPFWNYAMLKQRIPARQLADLITEKIGVAGLEIVVRKEHAYGWQPIVIASPGDQIDYQRRPEQIANRLRYQFDLRD